MYRLLKTILIAGLFIISPWACAEPLDINTATVEQLTDALNGVGKAKAEAIVQDREKNGKFKSVEDLDRVKGIGPAIIKKNRDKITVGAGAAAAPASAPAPAPAPASTNPK